MAGLDLKSRQLRAARICKSRGITRLQIAEAIGANQGRVSRILAGQTIRSSRVTREVLAYVEAFDGATVEMVRDNDELLEAAASVRDGSDAHAKALALVIRSRGALSRQDAGVVGRERARSVFGVSGLVVRWERSDRVLARGWFSLGLIAVAALALQHAFSLLILPGSGPTPTRHRPIPAPPPTSPPLH